MELDPKDTALLVHIEHSQPIEMNDFISSLTALNNLYSSFVKKNVQQKGISQSRLYVEKIEKGSIDFYLCERAIELLLPLAGNFNIIFEFSKHIKDICEYFKTKEGKKPDLDKKDCENFSNLLNVVCADKGAKMSVGAINKVENGNVFNNCTFNFIDGNASQNQIKSEEKRLEEQEPSDKIYSRVLMKIYQVRNDADSNIGNKAIIDEIFKEKKIAVLFDSDELKNKILFSDANPTQKAYQVDVKVQTIEDKPKAYKVLALHDVIDLD